MNYHIKYHKPINTPFIMKHLDTAMSVLCAMAYGFISDAHQGLPVGASLDFLKSLYGLLDTDNLLTLVSALVTGAAGWAGGRVMQFLWELYKERQDKNRGHE
jgi:hypothetical protein